MSILRPSSLKDVQRSRCIDLMRGDGMSDGAWYGASCSQVNNGLYTLRGSHDRFRIR